MVLFGGMAAYGQSTGQLLFPDETDPVVLDWGRDTVEAFLAAHQMPASEVTSIQTYARQDLRDNLRAFAWSALQLLLRDTKRALDPVEERLVTRFTEVVKAIDIEHLRLAKEDKDRFLANRCTWRPEAQIAQATGYTYDPAYWCPRPPYSPLFEANPPASPSKDFLLATGQKRSWLDAIAARPGGLRSISHISVAGGLHLAIGIPAAALLAIGLTAAMYALKWLKVAQETFNGGTTFVSRSLGAYVGVGITIALVLITVVILVVIYTENNRIEAEYSQIDSAYQTAASRPLRTRAQLGAALDSNRDWVGLYAAFLRMVVPLSAPQAPAALPTPGVTDPTFSLRVAPGSPSTPASSLTFAGWDGEKWRARLWRGWVLQEALLPMPNVDLLSLNSRIRYLWNGKKYEASRMGSYFAVKKAVEETGDVTCPPSSSSGESTAADLSQCKVFVTRSLPLDVDGLGARLVSITQALAFTSPAVARVAIGQPFSIPIATQGLPEATITVDGALPAGFSLGAGNMLGTATLLWNGNGTGGTYPITLRANNGLEQKTTVLTVYVSQTVRFTSPAEGTYSFPLGTYVNMPIIATGFPVPNVHVYTLLSGTCGLQLTRVSNSEWRLAGYLRPPQAPAQACFLSLEAYNSESFNLASPSGRDFLDLRINVTDPPQQPVLLTDQITTPMGMTRQYTIRTSTVNAPVEISLAQLNGQQMAPSWVSLQDRGDGTATMTVTPPVGAPQVALAALWYGVAGSAGNRNSGSFTGVSINVVREPVFVFPQGQVFRFDVDPPVEQSWLAGTQSVGGNVTFQVSPALPPGLQLQDLGNGEFRIRGRATEPGDYAVNVTATNSYGPATAPVRIIVAKAAQITSPAVAHLWVGRPNSFEVTATGYPTAPLGEPSPVNPRPMDLFPSSPISLQFYGLNMSATDPVTGEPVYGRAFITGTPTNRTSLQISVIAQTASLAPSIQQLRLVLTNYGDVSGDYVVDCLDVNLTKSLLGKRRGTALYNHIVDINKDGIIDVRDLAVVSGQLPSGTRCQ
ncbi:MAG: hypothetical protein JNK87_01725 [Bryobacterales bacterium]|nr:hypothetical protein [Bryobacterales bacterium]